VATMVTYTDQKPPRESVFPRDRLPVVVARLLLRGYGMARDPPRGRARGGPRPALMRDKGLDAIMVVEGRSTIGTTSIRPGSMPPWAHARGRTRSALRDLRVSPIPRMGGAGPSGAPMSHYSTQLRNSTGSRPPKVREERDGSRIAHVLRVRAVSPRTTRTGRSGGSRPGPARPPCDARRRRREIFREGGGTHGPDNHFDRGGRIGGAGRGRLGLLAVAWITLAAVCSAPGAARHRSVEWSERLAPWGARDMPPARAPVGARGGAGCVSGRTNL
jgi:hypothetical protein